MKENEIELTQLFRIATKFFYNSRYLFTIFSILGFLLGITFTVITYPLYRSNLVGISNILTLEDVSPIIDKTKNLIEDRNYSELANIIKLDSTELIKIKSIQVSSEIVAKNKKDEDIVTNKFLIEVITTDYSLFPKLNSLIPDLIRNNEYTKLKTDLITYSRKNLYNKLEKEIRILDSLKTNITPGITQGKSIFYVADPSALNEAVIKLYEQQMTVYESLNLRPDFLVIESFATLKQPINKKYVRNAVIGGAMGFFLCLFFLLIKEIGKIAKAN